MTWQLGAFALLGMALALGFIWYERSRPDARVVALVAVLAAFAALGRIAFAALPNVKPTTDIVLLSGYALGGAPGFAVGAIAGLTSNFFFGQGPWTPWQMAAWGAAGMIGAGLAVLTRGRSGRITLAAVCGVVGFGFTMVQDLGDWVTYSDHSVRALGVYVGRGIGFDLVHAVGCVGFALAFGPALAGSLRRFADRLTVRWLPAGETIATVLIAGAVAAGWSTSGTRTAVADAAQTPRGFLIAAQNADGGLGPSPGSASDPVFSGWAALGLEADGTNPANVRHGSGASLLDYVQSAPRPDPGSLERTILVLAAAGQDTGALVQSLRGQLRPDGSVADQVNLTAFAILALRSAGAPAPPASTRWLAAQQDADGGFSFATAGGGSDADDTGAALEALAPAGPRRTIARAIAFLHADQNSDGGFPSQPGADSNAQSTAWAVQGLVAAGAAGGSAAARAQGFLRGLIAPDGHVRYARASDQTPVWVTGQALMALDGKALPLAPLPSTSAPGPTVSGPAPGPARHRAAARHPAVRRGGRPSHRHSGTRRGSPLSSRAGGLGPLAAAAELVAVLAYAPVGI